MNVVAGRLRMWAQETDEEAVEKSFIALEKTACSELRH